VVVDEAVIHRVVGSASAISGQLRYLVDSAQQGKTSIRVMPYRAGAHAGTTGPFIILDFEELTDPTVVYVETLVLNPLAFLFFQASFCPNLARFSPHLQRGGCA
jgi:hypothetical protein